MKRFTAYRRKIDESLKHTASMRVGPNEPQFEAVIWSDGTVTLRWLTPCRSTSVWNSLFEMLLVHGHPEYGTEIVWHDHDFEPAEWAVMCAQARNAEINRLKAEPEPTNVTGYAAPPSDDEAVRLLREAHDKLGDSTHKDAENLSAGQCPACQLMYAIDAYLARVGK